MASKLNRIKTALVDNGKTNKWLAEQLGKDPATVSKWCTNACQPSLETLMQIAKLLNVQVDDLLRFDELPEIENTLLRKTYFNDNRTFYIYRCFSAHDIYRGQ